MQLFLTVPSWRVWNHNDGVKAACGWGCGAVTSCLCSNSQLPPSPNTHRRTHTPYLCGMFSLYRMETAMRVPRGGCALMAGSI